MSRPINSRRNRGSLRLVILSGALGAALMPVVLSGAPESPDVRILTYTLYVAAGTTPGTDPACPLKQAVEGAGITDLLGPVHDEQSDCVQADGTIDHGVFTLTAGASGGGQPGGTDSADSISGQYRARPVPTFASQLTNPPGGFWLIYGEVCTWKGTGKFAQVKNDCPTDTSPGQFVPARLGVDFTTNRATIFGTMVLHFNE